MAEVGSAFVSIIPSAKGFGSKLDSQVGGDVDKSGRRAGSRFGGALKVGALGVTAAAGGILGAALFKGFDRLKSIDQARAKLTGLGNSTRTVDKIMRNALASVKGTAFGLGDAATVSASAVAAGIKPGRQLRKTLKLVADAATIGGTSLGEMGAVFNKVAASNKIQGDVINQLNDQGIPIVQLLGKQMGVTSAKVTKLAAKGKIDFKTFSAAMQAGLGGAALKSGSTFSGALANVGASLSRIGAGLLGGIFPSLAPAFAGITAALAPLEGKAAGAGAAIGRVLAPALVGIGPFISKIVDGLTSMDFSKVSAGSGTFGKIAESFKALGSAFATIDFGKLGSALGQGTADTVNVFAVAVGFAADHLDTFAKILPALVVAFAAYKAAQAASNVLSIAAIPLDAARIVSNFALASANRQLAAQLAVTNGVENVSILTRARATVATIASTIATRAAAIGSRIWAAAQFLLNAALTANPIGLVVVAIAAFVAAIVIAYKKSETFRAIVRTAFAAAANGVRALGSVGRALWNNVFRPTFQFILGGISKLIGAFAKVIGVIAKIPGPQQAAMRKIASALDGAARHVDDLSGKLRKIPDGKAKVTVDLSQARSSLDSFVRLANGRTFTIHGNVARGMAARAKGGPVNANQTYLVGEEGPELFSSKQAGNITPNNRLSVSSGGAGVGMAGGLSGPVILRVGDQDMQAWFERSYDGERAFA